MCIWVSASVKTSLMLPGPPAVVNEKSWLLPLGIVAFITVMPVPGGGARRVSVNVHTTLSPAARVIAVPFW